MHVRRQERYRDLSTVHKSSWWNTYTQVNAIGWQWRAWICGDQYGRMQLMHVCLTWGRWARIGREICSEGVVAIGVCRHLSVSQYMHYCSHEVLQVGSQPMNHCSEWSPSIPRLYTCVQDSLLLLLAEWLQQVSAISYPPRVLKCSCKKSYATKWCISWGKQWTDSDREIGGRMCKAGQRSLEQWKVKMCYALGQRRPTSKDCGR